MQQHPVFHVSILQGHKPRPEEMLQPQGWEPVKLAESDADPVFEGEHILDSRGASKNDEFLVQRQGFPASAATWEPLSHLDGCKVCSRVFERARLEDGRKRKPKDIIAFKVVLKSVCSLRIAFFPLVGRLVGIQPVTADRQRSGSVHGGFSFKS